MIDKLSHDLVKLKQDFIKTYSGKSQLLEIIPKSFSIPLDHLEMLHQFATKNPIYYNSYELNVNGTDCIVYEGDINKYWLNSIQHESSHAPFSPTWIMSAYIIALYSKNLGYLQAVDIGSGDGRIAFCAKVLGMISFGIELDRSLALLQKSFASIVDFDSFCADATCFDYSLLNLSAPMFFIGGLAQMGGTVMTSGILDKIDSNIKKRSGWAFAGTLSPKYAPDPKNEAGWGTLIADNHLEKISQITLPTAWTFSEPDDTPYIFASQNNRNPN